MPVTCGNVDFQLPFARIVGQWLPFKAVSKAVSDLARRAPPRLRSNDLDRTTRSHAIAVRSPDRTAHVRTQRSRLPPHTYGGRRARRLSRQGRKERITPLTTTTITVLQSWLTKRAGKSAAPLFPTRSGHALSRDAIEHRITHYAGIARQRCPSLQGKKVTAHVLRHATAMRLLHAGVDTSVIALWLGHVSVETTQIYLHADLKLKERALARTRPTGSRAGRYRPPDRILVWLEAL
jgi:hypothetical protein